MASLKSPPPLKVTIVSQFVWPENFKINDLISDFDRRGYAIEVLTGQPNYPSGKFFEGYSWFSPWKNRRGNAVFKRIPVIPRGAGSPLMLLLNYVSFLILGLLIFPFRFNRGTDVIFVWNSSPIFSAIPALFLKFLFRRPAIIWVQDLWPDSLEVTGLVRSKFLLAIARWCCLQIYKNFDTVLSQSPAMKQRLIEMGVSAAKVDVVSNWAEDFYRPLDPQTCIEKDRELPQGFRVVFAGNIGQAQSFSTIVKAAELSKDWPDIKWLVFGDGRERRKIEENIRGRDLQIFFMGTRRAEEMAEYFAVCDVLLVTLKSDPTMAITIPGKLQSYLACQKPIMACIDGEAARIVTEAKAGFACRAEDSQALAEGIVAMYKMPEIELKKMAVSGRNFYQESFDRNKMIEKVDRLLRNIGN